ncbi:high mobility group B protein 13-like [Oryza brachyantha]|uniref:HMG box domain-containing protein n=1 Tax=Oryza brachyantha TaxID=4533 RepID=J3LBH6_ORYBR|nr:high mobility group B protein 13-like [Oryza brachyantha]
MATATATVAVASGAGSRKSGRGRKALTAVLDNDANISAGKAGSAAGILSPPPQKAKRASSKGKGKAAAAAAVVDEVSELQGMLEKLRLEKEKAEEMVRERDEVIRRKEEEQGRLQAELKKIQRAKEFKPTVSIPLVKSLIEEGDGKAKKKKGKGKAGHERKKPCPAYALWCKDQWNEIKRTNPEADFKEVSNALGTKWKALGAEEKQPYEERYRVEKEAYLQVVGQEKREAEAMKLLEEEQMQRTAKELLEQYVRFRQEAAADNGDKKAKNKGKKKDKDPSKPKHPMSAYFVYSQERRAALIAEKKNVPEIGRITGEEWKGMTEAEKAPYEEAARKQKEEYQKQMEAYRQRKEEEAASQEKEEEEQKEVMKQEALQLLKKKEKADNIIKKTKEQRQRKKKGAGGAAAADPNRPKKPASSFLLFSREARRQLAEERPGVASSTLNALVAVKWKEMGEAERQAWNGRAAEVMAAYKSEMEEYTKAHAGGGGASPCASSSASS